jgi:ubiquitin C-terminal hydrolase
MNYSYIRIDDPKDKKNGKWFNFNDQIYNPIDFHCPFTSDSVINIFYRMKNP